ncbi:hypothetical protein NKH54_18375 [Mesorhizobium sp. M1004]|uniref:hypothetical protein n=1 Tax=Mesorhizobium sp. M1004 TaxID=2957046 RepID=UPI003335E9BE
MKTLKVEAIYPMVLETFEEVAAHLPHFIDEVYNKRRLRVTVQGMRRPRRGRSATEYLLCAGGFN